MSYPRYFYEKILNNDFKTYESEIKADAIASAVRFKIKDVRVEKNVVEDYFTLNGFFAKPLVKPQKKKKQK